MAGLLPPLTNGSIQNWLKGAIGILFAKEGLTEFVRTEFTEFHTDLLNSILASHEIPAGTTCNSCTTANLLNCHTQGFCKVIKGLCKVHDSAVPEKIPNQPCPNRICDSLMKAIRSEHRYESPSWKNTDARSWCKDPFEVAKCYLPPDGYSDIHSFEETGFNGILSVIINNKRFQSKLAAQLNTYPNSCTKARDIGREIRHSPNHLLTDADCAQYIIDLINLLTDPKYLASDPKAQIAVNKLKELQANTLTIHANDITKIIHDNIGRSISTQQQAVLHDIQNHLSDVKTASICVMNEIVTAKLTALNEISNEAERIKTEINVHTGQKKQNFDEHAGLKSIKLLGGQKKQYFELHMNLKKQDIDSYADQKKQDIDLHVDQTKQDIEIHANQKKHDIDVHTDQKKHDIDVHTDQKKQDIEHIIDRKKQDIDLHEYAETKPPHEIIQTDRRSIELALAQGKVAIHNIRVMIVGYYGVGKTTLTKRLLAQDVEIGNGERTDGIKVHVHNCEVDIDTGNWVNRKRDDESESIYRRLATILKQINVEKEEEEEADNEEMTKPMPEDNITDKHSNTGSASLRAQKTNPSLTETVSSQSQQVTGPDKFNNDVSNDQARYFEDLAKELQKLPKEDNTSKAYVSFWDFAGQYAFYDTHQVFLSRRTIYLLVTDISKSIDAIVEGDDCYPDSKGKSQWKVSDFVEFWLKSIHEFCYHSEEADSHLTTEHASGSSDHNRPPFGPPVILVGTFSDKLNQSDRKETVHKYFSSLRQHLVEKNVFVANSHLIENNFDIDNTLTTETSNIELLKEQIIKTAKEQSYWGEHVPARWVTLEKVIVNLRSEGVKVLSKGQIVVLNSHLPFPIPNDEKIEKFLKFHHECGHIIYYSKDEGLKQSIILDPQWLVDAFKCLITAEHFCCKSPIIHNEWIEFNKTAVCDRALIDKIWNSYEASDFKDHKDLLLNFLNRLGLIVQQSQKKDEFNLTDESMKGNTFLAPCILKDAPPQDVIENASYRKTTSKLCFTTRSGFLPTAVFNKLLAAFIQKYPITHYRTKQNKTQYHIYCGCGFFDVPNNHEMVLFFQDNMIQIWLSKYGDEEPDNKTCFEQCEFVMTFLKCRLTTLKISVKCLEASAYTSAGIFAMETLLNKEKVLCDCHYPRRHEVSTEQLTKYWCERSSPDATPNQNARSMIQFPSGSNTGTLSQLGKSIPVTGAELTSYKMDRKPRGWCIIINNEKFSSIAARTGTQLDKDRLTRTFQRLHFIVESRDNLKSTEIIKYLNEVSRNYDHSSHDCFVCCILSHGKLGHVCGSDDSVVPIKDMTSEFNALRCPSLAGKPKLFFLQACQGSDLMPGVPAATDIQTDACREETIPSEADFLLGFSTVPGYVSYRDTQSGTWYIRALCEALEEHWDRYSLLDILTEVNRKVAKESTADRGCVYKQIPAPQTTLTKPFYFR